MEVTELKAQSEETQSHASFEETSQEEKYHEVEEETPFDQRDWHAIVHNQQDAEREIDEQMLGYETDLEYLTRVDERDKRRQQLRETLVEEMPWSDARFLKINVRSARPLECSSDEEWTRMLQGNLGATVRVKVGPATFWCIGALLNRHSGFFRPQSREEYSLPELTPIGFRAAYAWMRLQEPLNCSVQSEHSEPNQIVDLLFTAQHLDIRDLEMLCNRYLCSSHFTERRALQVYVRAKHYGNMGSICQLMLKRVGKYYLTMVGSQEYTEMPLEDICTLLEQDSIGVNTELEVFYGALRWMCIDPEERLSALPRLMECVRFTRMPRPKLLEMWFCLFSARWGLPLEWFQVRGDPIILRAFAYCPGLWERVNKAVRVANLCLQFDNHQVLMALIQACRLQMETPREWICDENCPYHVHNRTPPPQVDLSSKQFLSFAISLAQEDRDLLRSKEKDLTKLWEPLWDPQRDHPNNIPFDEMSDDLPMSSSDEIDWRSSSDDIDWFREILREAPEGTDTDDDTDNLSDIYVPFTDSPTTSPRNSPLISATSSPATNSLCRQLTTAWLSHVQLSRPGSASPRCLRRRSEAQEASLAIDCAPPLSCNDKMEEFLEQNQCTRDDCACWRKEHGYSPDPNDTQLKALCQFTHDMGYPTLMVPFFQLYKERCKILEEPSPNAQEKPDKRETSNSLAAQVPQTDTSEEHFSH
ncbi:uncharacterized protein [Drosophila pseudoobscura]|uniref:BACK domain-containing protein n=1 Tax=Drosophila pseudoobscura pseudoobscura TaxID=46245 RepID=A0A6I8VJ19_DROPS|nr:uncharacterized protein LOC4814366 [Drosophila pseudoobscura]